MERCVEEVPRYHLSAVGERVEEALPPIEGGVEANGEPEVPRSPECETHDEAQQGGGEGADPRFTLIIEVCSAKERREQDRGGPEPHATGKRELGIAAEEQLFK